MPIILWTKTSENNLYIAGGETNEKLFNSSGAVSVKKEHEFSCDRYDIKNEKYYVSEYNLPYPVNSFDKVTTSAKEAFAIILTKGKGTILSFTEKDGFSEIPNFTIFGKRSVNKPFFYNPSTTVLLKIK